MKQKRLDAPVLEFWYLVGDDLRQHLWEFHAQGFIHKGVETDLEKALYHLQETCRPKTLRAASNIVLKKPQHLICAPG